MSKKVLILGAGYAGIEAALTLHKKKKAEDDLEITLIDRNPYHTLLTELHEVAGNRISEDGIIVPLRDIFKYTDVKIIKDEIHQIDFNSSNVKSGSKEYSYDYLVLAAGSEPNYYGIPGLEEHCFPLWSYDNAINIREHIKECFIKASQEQNADKRRSLLTFVVGGAGFTGVEMVGELALWVKSLCKEYSIPRESVKIVLIEALPQILSVLKEKNIKKAMNYLVNKLHVEVCVNSSISSVDSNSVQIKGGQNIPTETVIWTAGVRASCITDEIDIEKGKACRIGVNKYTQTQYDNVYAVGDISGFVSEGITLPALVETALQTGKAAAKNILASIRKKELEELKPNLHGVMVSIGSYFAVSDLMGHQLPRLISLLMKYMVNIHYLFGIGGFELVFKYIKHEFLFKKQAKILPEKHISMITPTFWLVPIRLFLGYSWIREGINKINEDWLNTAILSGLNTGTDATTSASVTFPIISAHTPGWYAWFASHFVIPNAVFFQTMIVLTEIALGLALISGTFTFIAAIASIGLNINFILSTGMYPYDYWYIAAALCLLGGAGRAFGLDYYIMPYLMKQWRYFTRNKRLKIRI
jgi:NADH:ubiquinone reductase (H+-translocating)